ncbi:hypothetical protein DAEQUDRAFT_218139 [Daedalea quercina L-15889]|uniref:Uncharacterized protein n=1 Tax=Daedalea quercina L-15889 TaxID=1314783 RepID=A0A165R5H5_9APHY|nr:hypothetical protein DAEQUDRAFT_218139 [Daedalea quercina L-15889]
MLLRFPSLSFSSTTTTVVATPTLHSLSVISFPLLDYCSMASIVYQCYPTVRRCRLQQRSNRCLPNKISVWAGRTMGGYEGDTNSFGLEYRCPTKGKGVRAWECVSHWQGAFTLRVHPGRPPSDPPPRSPPPRRQPQRVTPRSRCHRRPRPCHALHVHSSRCLAISAHKHTHRACCAPALLSRVALSIPGTSFSPYPTAPNCSSRSPSVFIPTAPRVPIAPCPSRRPGC